MESSFKSIIRQLEKQRIAIDRAIGALREVGDESVAEQITPIVAPARKKRAQKAVKKRSALSPEARERIAAAQRKRWAAQKRSAGTKSAAKKAASKKAS